MKIDSTADFAIDAKLRGVARAFFFLSVLINLIWILRIYTFFNFDNSGAPSFSFDLPIAAQENFEYRAWLSLQYIVFLFGFISISFMSWQKMKRSEIGAGNLLIFFISTFVFFLFFFILGFVSGGDNNSSGKGVYVNLIQYVIVPGFFYIFGYLMHSGR